MLREELAVFELDAEGFEEAVALAEEVRAVAEAAAPASGDGLPGAVGAIVQALATTSIDDEIEEDAAVGQGPACAAGCSACCHIPVSATTADVALLLRWLATQPPAVRRDVERRVDDALPRATRPGRGALACPLLDVSTDTCRAYEYRPLACRGCFSDDASRCTPGGTIEAFVVPQIISRSAAVGARVALLRQGADGSCGDLIVSLAKALGRPVVSR